MRLRDKVAIVTGGGNGIGQAICELFAEEGAKVVVADIDPHGAAETAGRIKSAGGDATVVRTDVSRESEVQNMVDAALDAYGTLNILVNDAAAFVFGQVEDVTDADWQRVMGVNVIGPAYCVKHALPPMKKAGGGSIVMIASISSFIAHPGFVPYSTSKGALLQLTRCLALDLAPHNIRVNCVCPGAVLTDATERHRRFVNMEKDKFLKAAADPSMMKRIADPREIAHGALFLASDESSFMTGAPLIMDGGLTAQ